MHLTLKYFKNFLENVWELTKMRNFPRREKTKTLFFLKEY